RAINPAAATAERTRLRSAPATPVHDLGRPDGDSAGAGPVQRPDLRDASGAGLPLVPAVSRPDVFLFFRVARLRISVVARCHATVSGPAHHADEFSAAVAGDPVCADV